MALTRQFKKTVVARARRDAKFRDAMFAEAINAYLAGDTKTGKAMLRDLVNATLGFEGLSAEIRKPSKSLHRMLATRGNPSTENFFGIVKALQRKTRARLRVAVQAPAPYMPPFVPLPSNSVVSVALQPGESVEWTWTTDANGARYVSGYTIVRTRRNLGRR